MIAFAPGGRYDGDARQGMNGGRTAVVWPNAPCTAIHALTASVGLCLDRLVVLRQVMSVLYPRATVLAVAHKDRQITV